MGVYDSIGGARMLRTAVDLFYRRVLADPALQGFFEGVDVERLSAHQRSFLAMALGGPDLYGGRELAEAHQGMVIGDAEFDAMSGHLVGVLRDLGVGGEELELAIERVEGFRDAVVASPLQDADQLASTGDA
ncbi:group 1 truncated hemoglobin [Catenulispora subtropica]|uniref:Group 1 truncated hemoglobin n=1 Tax=Catenulispora subtropica TaxID=450798 RepID=A0ABP5DS68_9ACTN